MKTIFYALLLLLFFILPLQADYRFVYICEEVNGCKWYIDKSTLEYDIFNKVLNYQAIILVSNAYREQLSYVNSREHSALRSVANKLSRIYIHQSIDTAHRLYRNIDMVLYDVSLKQLKRVRLNNSWSPIGYETPVSEILYWVDIDALIAREELKIRSVFLSQQNTQVSPNDEYTSMAKRIAFSLFINGVIISIGLGILIANWDTTSSSISSFGLSPENVLDSFYSRLKKFEKIFLLLVICDVISGLLVFFGIKAPLEWLDEIGTARANFALLCVWFFVRYSYYRAEQFQMAGRKIHGNILRLFGTLMYFLILYGYIYYSFVKARL